MGIQIGGLASGLDTDAIVKELMQAEQVRVDKVEQDKTLAEWTRDAYNDINQKFAEFIISTRESFGLTDSSSGVLLNKSVSSLKWIKGANSSNATVAQVSARADAVNGTYQINVKQLATNWSAASGGAISENAIHGDRSNLQSQFALEENDKIHFEIATQNKSIEVFIDNITGIESNSYVQIKDKEGNIINRIDLEGDTSNISLNDLVKQINQTNIGVTAIYDETIDRFFLQTSETGLENTIQIIEYDVDGVPISGGGFFNKLNLQYNNNGKIENIILNTQYAGQNAIIDFGAAQNISQSSNQFTINNIHFDLKSTGLTTVMVSTNEDAVIEKITDFVDKYNDLVEEVNKLLSQKRYREYPPLTKAQRDEMKEKEIELWEEKAKSGLLRNDSIIHRTLQRMRSGLYEKVQGMEGDLDALTKIGITTQTYSSGSAGGKLTIDEKKLREAIRKDVDGVIQLLFKQPDPSITEETEKRENTGLISRLYGDLITGMKEIIAKAGPGDDSELYRNVNSSMLIDFVTNQSSISMLDKNIINYEKRILDLERRFKDIESRYWSQFTAMEKALASMNAQSNWLYQQLGM
ncbi:flagellar filament capping protein FliD [Garciella nitratireducens]|uniref:Flagellar hook-associated protein 2 n=1 Tax=Garciella nitratireducens DSM 15102 TaxID=1121911 RepID=A0A1T4LED9_9FIRM|nr:flagellar filament capping protein FliD [Garciella nitratireducens]SJZ53105.1 flagellar hook-associated protein 2 [Garciella nitratireducens DSM 15102]